MISIFLILFCSLKNGLDLDTEFNSYKNALLILLNSLKFNLLPMLLLTFSDISL
jgi:hypothetical protein